MATNILQITDTNATVSFIEQYGIRTGLFIERICNEKDWSVRLQDVETYSFRTAQLLLVLEFNDKYLLK